MSKAFAWQPCNRLLEERWRESEHQQHRARLESIHAANALAGRGAPALAPSGSSGNIHTSRSGVPSSHPTRTSSSAGGTSTVKLVSRSKSPAAKSRQKQIDRENLILIKKIIALDNASSKANSNTAATAKQHRIGNTTAKVAPPKLTGAKKNCQTQSAPTRNTIVIPERSANSHECKLPLPDMPPASCHPLYTHHSATMANNFADLNSSTLNFSKTWDRNRTQLKIQDENKRLLQRILSARKSYSRTQWSEQERERRKLLRNISRHHHGSSSSTGRLSHYYGDGDDEREQVSTCERGRSLRRHNSSSDELISTAAAGIRLLHTTHLRSAQQQQRQPQPLRRPLSASAATGCGAIFSGAWAAGEVSSQLAQPSCRTPASESIVQRMRSMTIDKRDYDRDDRSDGDDQDQEDDQDADYGDAHLEGKDGGDDDDDDDDVLH